MTKNARKTLTILTATALIAAMTVTATGCGKTNDALEAPSVGSEEAFTAIGEGEKEFTFLVTDAEGSTKGYEVHTDKTIVGEALLELGLIAGEEGDYGLYVKTVDGVTLDFDTDGKYWAFYIDGEYAMSGVDATDIVVGAEYGFKAE